MVIKETGKRTEETSFEEQQLKRTQDRLLSSFSLAAALKFLSFQVTENPQKVELLQCVALDNATKRARVEKETENKPVETSRYAQVGSGVGSFWSVLSDQSGSPKEDGRHHDQRSQAAQAHQGLEDRLRRRGMFEVPWKTWVLKDLFQTLP